MKIEVRTLALLLPVLGPLLGWLASGLAWGALIDTASSHGRLGSVDSAPKTYTPIEALDIQLAGLTSCGGALCGIGGTGNLHATDRAGDLEPIRAASAFSHALGSHLGTSHTSASGSPLFAADRPEGAAARVEDPYAFSGTDGSALGAALLLYSAVRDAGREAGFYSADTPAGTDTGIGSVDASFETMAVFDYPTQLYGVSADMRLFSVATAAAAPTDPGAITAGPVGRLSPPLAGLAYLDTQKEPEPPALMLLAGAGAGLLWMRRRFAARPPTPALPHQGGRSKREPHPPAAPRRSGLSSPGAGFSAVSSSAKSGRMASST